MILCRVLLGVIVLSRWPVRFVPGMTASSANPVFPAIPDVSGGAL
jgi:hypothetical protein